MSSNKFGDWLQIIGTFGVLGGLIFVGLEIRQDRQIAKADAVDAYAQGLKDWAGLISDNADVWLRGTSGEHLEGEDAAKFYALASAWELTRYGAWFRASETVSEQSTNRFARETAFTLCQNPGLLRFWQQLNERLDVIEPSRDRGYQRMIQGALESFDESGCEE